MLSRSLLCLLFICLIGTSWGIIADFDIATDCSESIGCPIGKFCDLESLLCISDTIVCSQDYDLQQQAAQSARSIVVYLDNETPRELTLQQLELSHGEWLAQAPNTIAAETCVAFACVSNGFMTGTSGTLTYSIGDNGNLYLLYDNPFAGGNSYNYTFPIHFNVAMEGGSGNNAVVQFTLANTTVVE
jgi:hypothetical protein